ncbi:hypothetical protein PVL29_004454 [Vitis rotundifolia]|uniref:NAC domain-containing protein n=1 Tax=Vitis rotundifolia TaxID=103349 RepID=A0AA39DYH1_VITRO|nr:hypothetical protein PVL29_004454 [Vitis rotundifolia]
MNLLQLGEDASLQTAPQEVQNNHSEDGKHFDLNSLPPGYRFNPTDAEIIVFYLKKKVDHQPLPPNKIIEVNLYAYDPEELAARYKPSGNDEWFYFTPRDRKYRNGQRPNRSVEGGYWKATGADKEIKFEDRTVGYRKVLVFYRGSPPKGVKTNWIMHEFRVAEPPEPPRRTGVNDMRLDECVLCKVYRKDKRVCKRSRHESGVDESGSPRPKTPRFDRHPNPNEANNQHTVGGGMDSGEDRNGYQYNQNINSHQALQNQRQLQQPIIQMPTANAVFPQDNLQVLPPAGTDVSFHGHNSNRIHQALQNQQQLQLQLQQPIIQMPTANAVFPQDNLQVLPPAGTDVSFHGHNSNLIHQALQNQQQQQLQLQQPIIQRPTANAVFPQDNLQALPPAGTDVSFHGHNSNLMQSMEYPFPGHPWGMYSEFHNTGFASTMDLKPGYMTGVNIDPNTRSASFSSPRLW